MSEIENYLSTRKAAELLDVSLRTVQLWVENGTLVAWKTAGGHRRILMKSVDKILKQRVESMQQSESDGELVMVLVEDDKDIRDAYCLSIEMLDLPIKLVTAENGYDGLLKIGKHLPDIIMTDLMMPNMDGFEMLSAIKHDQTEKSPDIIVVTALDLQSIKMKKISNSNVNFMKKPVQFEKLEALLRHKLTNMQGVR
ncbi:MAG: response regulator [Gammaproteobacteria bacterium]|nr:response regulator [Gammaproteobacteria bacterium]